MAARARVGSDMWGRCGIRRARGTRWAGADNLCRRTWWAVWSWTRRSWSWSGWAVWTWAGRAGPEHGALTGGDTGHPAPVHTGGLVI